MVMLPFPLLYVVPLLVSVIVAGKMSTPHVEPAVAYVAANVGSNGASPFVRTILQFAGAPIARVTTVPVAPSAPEALATVQAVAAMDPDIPLLHVAPDVHWNETPPGPVK
jgi:glycerol uptake facilitator-like aquaporin